MTDEQGFLANWGDPIEKEGLGYDLRAYFPRYADFWLNFVYPNRRPGDSSKLESTIPSEIENLFNAHYSVWYQLTIAYRQLHSLDDPLVEPGDVLFHLATAIDLIELALVLALELEAQLRKETLISEWTKERMDVEVARFWEKDYSKNLQKFREKYKPVGITFHSITGLFTACMPKGKSYKAFASIANKIRPYRNQLAHNLSPVNLVGSEGKMIPKPEHIQTYAGGRYSSIEPVPDHFAPAGQILEGLASELVQSTNDLWEILLRTTLGIVGSSEYRDRVKSFKALGFESSSIEDVTVPDLRLATGGTAEYPMSDSPKRPSGIQIVSHDND